MSVKPAVPRPAARAPLPWVAGLALTLLACGPKEEARSGPASIDSTVAGSTARTALSRQSVVSLVRGVIADTLEVPVRILPDERRTTQVIAPAEGRIEEVFIRTPGQFLRAGEPLALLYSPELVAAQREYLSLDPRRDAGLLRQAEDRLLRMGLTASHLRTIRNSRRPLERIPIASPRNGFVLFPAPSAGESMPVETTAGGPGMEAGMGGMSGGGMAEGNPAGGMPAGAEAEGPQPSLRAGAPVARGTVLAQVNDLAVVEAVLIVPVRDLPLLRQGDSVHLSLAAAGYEGMAAVGFLESRVADTSGNVEVRAYLRNPGFRLRLGILGTGHIAPRPETTWVLPRAALHDLGDRHMAWVRDAADTGVFHAQEVRVGRMGARLAEVLEGLPSGSRVAENASMLLDPDAAAEPRPMRAEAPGDPHSGHADAPDPHSGHAAPAEAGHGDHAAHVASTGNLKVTETQAERAGIRIAVAGEAHVAPTRVFRAVTRLDARSLEDVPAKAEGRIEEVRAQRVGEKVARGQILAVLRSEPLQAAQEEFLAARKAAAALADPELVQAQLGAARRRLRVLGMTGAQVSALERTGKASALHAVLSPRDGILTEVRALPGRYVAAGSPLFTVGLSGRIGVETWMLAAEAERFPVGTAAGVRVEGIPGGELAGRLEQVSRATTLSGSAYLGQIGISDTGGRMVPGMQAWVTFRLPGRHVLAVPPSALIRSSGSAMAWVRVGEDAYSPRMVRTGEETPEAVEILEGIRAGEAIVVAGAYLLNSEWTIRQGAGNIHAGH